MGPRRSASSLIKEMNNNGDKNTQHKGQPTSGISHQKWNIWFSTHLVKIAFPLGIQHFLRPNRPAAKPSLNYYWLQSHWKKNELSYQTKRLELARIRPIRANDCAVDDPDPGDHPRRCQARRCPPSHWLLRRRRNYAHGIVPRRLSCDDGDSDDVCCDGYDLVRRQNRTWPWPPHSPPVSPSRSHYSALIPYRSDCLNNALEHNAYSYGTNDFRSTARRPPNCTNLTKFDFHIV